ncbi:ribonuclease III [Caldichromatium japonicum]|uniref:Ribonuclease 3 n=1 Tax=Caldichromatium japonicum TaxID=2699430 RepID=A0A6G7VB64_9GAMM|nr:ribonuclease III [Caldichromatium japonicum]QIK37115.1 ribonuclease III [Caldichromatium japonicum]
MNTDLMRFAQVLGHRFQREDLLVQALTHRSFGAANNERLEFLGDALLGFVIAEILLERFPTANEGTLSRMRAALVKREALAALARDLRLGEVLRLGAGELRTGGHARDSILADALEAVFGAVYLDAGFERARAVVLERFASRLAQIDASESGKDPKTRLQEWLQGARRPLPDYQVLAIEGEQHDQIFTVSCQLQDAELMTQGTGTSRRRAEQSAAERMLELLRRG